LEKKNKMLKTEKYEYKDGDTLLEGYVASDPHQEKRPVILVVHDWSGLNDFARGKADKLAELGYVGFAVDMYGNGKVGKTKEEKSALMQPLMQNRYALQQRMLAAFEAAKQLPMIDANQIGAIGFCFGGLCALDLARSGADVKGVASFHGLLNAPEDSISKQITAKVLVLHGFDDPMVTPETVMHFGEEMTEAKANWELDMYGNTMHGFTNPEANDPSFGTVYNKQAETRSWTAMREFFGEVFAGQTTARR
jgi:dienelactone hydrolase